MRPWLLSRCFAALVVSMCLLMALASGCGRSSLEPESLDGGSTVPPTPGGCNASTCSNGCCDSSGVCQTGRNVRSCGSIGGACTDCIASGFDSCTDSRVCSRVDPGCDATSCAGCCGLDATGALSCLSGTESTACGRSGSTCTNCEDDGRACDLSTRTCGTTRCDASNCDGCCVGDLCLPGNSSVACGANGGQCGRCSAGQVCRVSSVGGGRCEGTSACGPANCGGCCTANGQCRGGDTQGSCGRLGQRCDACGPNEFCAPDGFPGARTCQPIQRCGPDNCTGCCSGDTCVLATNEDFCGIKGQQCDFCFPGETCNPNGFCEFSPTCNASNCPGCCIGDICAIGSQNTACGFNGQQCENCSNQGPGLTCQSGSCQTPSCSPFTCPFGCCQGNTCVTGTQDKACGGGFGGGPFPVDGGFGGGQQCQDCTITNQSCVGQTCQSKCGPANCNGCCNGNNCVNGIANNACGSGGQACDNCNADGSFCNGLVIPRRCNNDQTTCPAAYGSCPAGITTEPTKELQGVCTDAQLDAVALACANNPTGALCQGAINAVPVACRTCVARFNHPFARNTGLFACAATFVGDACRRSLGCSTDCASDSCTGCTTGTQTQCFTLVNQAGGQCRTFQNATSCANNALAAGELCSQFSYSDYGEWLRAIGGRFCGNGP